MRSLPNVEEDEMLRSVVVEACIAASMAATSRVHDTTLKWISDPLLPVHASPSVDVECRWLSPLSLSVLSSSERALATPSTVRRKSGE